MKRSNKTFKELKRADKNNILESVGVDLKYAKRQATAMGLKLWSCRDCYFIVNDLKYSL